MSYFIEVPDMNGEMVKVEVSAAVHEVFEDERKQLERERNESRRHRTDVTLCEVLKTKSDNYSLDDRVIACEKLEKALEVISKCTETQRRRFYLNRIDGYSLVEIAKMEVTNVSSVHRSVQAVAKQLKKVL